MDPGWGWYALTLRVSYMIVILAISCDVFHLAMRVGGWLPVSALCPVELCQVTKEWNSASRKRAGLWCQATAATCCVTCWQGNRWNLNLHEPPMWEWVWTIEIYWDYPIIPIYSRYISWHSMMFHRVPWCWCCFATHFRPQIWQGSQGSSDPSSPFLTLWTWSGPLQK